MFSTNNIFVVNPVIGIDFMTTVAVIKGVLIFVRIQNMFRNVIGHF